MAKLKLTNKDDIERKLRNIINKKQKQLINDFEKYLIKQSEILGNKFAQSNEFKEIKTTLKGEFGFTDQEIIELDNIIDVIKNDRRVTKIKATATTVILEWVDFEVLKNHSVAKHELTKRNPKTGNFEVQQVVSWVDWLENGLSVTGYSFEDGGGKFSRSREGRMVEGGAFRLPKTRIFEKIAKSINKKEIIGGLAVILEKKVK